MTKQSKVEQSNYIVSLGRGECQIKVEKEREEPIYKQVAGELRRLVEGGLLPHGSRLPAIRKLAKELEVTHVTVHHAYNELCTQGYADATVGRGTFVKSPRLARQEPLELSASKITPDRAMADLSVLKEHPDIISLAMAEPDPSFAPAEDFLRLFRGLEKDAQTLLSYGPYQGSVALREMLMGVLREQGIQAEMEDIIVTTGVTQGLSLAVGALCERGDKVLVEEPTYLGFLSLLRSYGLEPIGLPMQEDGPCLETLEEVLIQQRPRVYYTVPSFQNPAGTCISSAKRASILELAHKYHVTLIEDDIYGHLNYDDLPLRPLKADDTQGHVLYLNSFSKLLFPGLRLGYMVPPAGLRDRLMSLVRCRELCGSPLLQQALTKFLRRGSLHAHIQRVLPRYKQRRDALLEALAESMPEEVHWSRPQGGFCCWLSLPTHGNFEELYREALNHGVAFTPGAVFFISSSSTHHLRLCFGTQTPDAIRNAVKVLADLIQSSLRRPFLGPQHHNSPMPIV